jgi:hypothetical protein
MSSWAVTIEKPELEPTTRKTITMSTEKNPWTEKSRASSKTTRNWRPARV